MKRGAIIGLGKIALTAHLPAYEKISDKIKIVAGVDIHRETLQQVSNQYPEIRLYDNLDTMFENENIDFVDICSTPKTHYDILSKVANKGINIICEKPFSISLNESISAAEIIKKNNIAFIPCHQYRYSPIWKEFKKMSEETKEQKIFAQFNVIRMKADEGYSISNTGWRTNSSYSGGGIIADTGVHYIYLVYWMIGEPLKITSNIYNISHNYEVEDTAIIIIETKKGVAQINLSWGGDKRYNSATMISKNAGLYYDGEKMVKNFNGNEKIIPVPDASDKTHYINYYVDLFKEFLSEIDDKKNKDYWLKEAVNSISILENSYKSAKIGQTISK